MPDFDIQSVLAELTRSIGQSPADIKPIAESGSARKYYRIFSEKGTLIGAYNANIEENEAFFYLTEHFGKIGLYAPNSCVYQFFCIPLRRNCNEQGNMEPKVGDKMKVSPQLTAQADWIDGEVIDVEHNPFMGLVISIKDKLGRIFFGQSRFFVAL